VAGAEGEEPACRRRRTREEKAVIDLAEKDLADREAELEWERERQGIGEAL